MPVLVDEHPDLRDERLVRVEPILGAAGPADKVERSVVCLRERDRRLVHGASGACTERQATQKVPPHPPRKGWGRLRVYR